MDTNIEAAVRRALTAYAAEDGTRTPAAAAAFAAQHLATGIQKFTEGLSQVATGPAPAVGTSLAVLQAYSQPAPGSMPADNAFTALKAWATTLL
jgi:hypothetical protein